MMPKPIFPMCPDCNSAPGVRSSPAVGFVPSRMVCSNCWTEMRSRGFARYHKTLNRRLKAEQEAAIASIASSYTRQRPEG